MSHAQSAVSRSAVEIQDWIVARLARVLEIPPHEIDPNEELARFGLDSVQLVMFVTDLEQWLGQRFTHNPLSEHVSIRQLCEQLTRRSA